MIEIKKAQRYCQNGVPVFTGYVDDGTSTWVCTVCKMPMHGPSLLEAVGGHYGDLTPSFDSLSEFKAYKGPLDISAASDGYSIEVICNDRYVPAGPVKDYILEHHFGYTPRLNLLEKTHQAALDVGAAMWFVFICLCALAGAIWVATAL